MPSSTLPYFYDESLAARFSLDLDAALDASRITTDEQLWLSSLVVDSAFVAKPATPRIDQLRVNPEHLLSAELASAVLISDPTSLHAPVYLSTLLDGLERFADRHQLLAALKERFTPAGSGAVSFSYEQISTPLYVTRMNMILNHELEHLREVARCLCQIPSLRSVMHEALTRQFSLQLPDASFDLSLPLVQIQRSDDPVASASTTGSALSLSVQTITEAALGLYVNQALPTNHYRAYLTDRGQRVDLAQALLYEQVLTATVASVTPAYESMVSEYWQSPALDGQTPRALGAQAMAQAARQHLLIARERSALSANELTLLGKLLREHSAPDPGLQVQRITLTTGKGQPVKLAGMFLLVGDSQLLVYSPLQGFRRFATLNALSDHFTTLAGRRELHAHVSLNDHALLNAAGTPVVGVYDVQLPPFLDCMDAVIGLQKRNLAFVLSREHLSVNAAAAMIDDALDIRHLIDMRLASSESRGRWTRGGYSFIDRWLAVPAPSSRALAPSATARSAQPLTWTDRIAILDNQAQSLRLWLPSIEECARQMLNEYLALFCQPGLDAADVSLRWSASVEDAPPGSPAVEPEAQMGTCTLVAMLLEIYSGYRDASVPERTQVYRSSTDYELPEAVTWLTPAFINLVLQRLQGVVGPSFMQQVKDSHAQPFRLTDSQCSPKAVAERILADALRLEQLLNERIHADEQKPLMMFKQLLNYPVRAMREVFGDHRVEAYTASLEYGAQPALAPVSNVFILRTPLHARTGAVMCWSILMGLELFDSLAALEGMLNRRIARRSSRERWLALLCDSDARAIREQLGQNADHRLALRYSKVDGDFVQALLDLDQERRLADVQQALQVGRYSSMAADVLVRSCAVTLLDERMSLMLDTISTGIQGVILQNMLPKWLADASEEDLAAYAWQLQRHYLTNDPGTNFLRDVPTLQSFSRQQLIRQLAVDFPGQPLNPDEIKVRLTLYIPSPVPVGEMPSFIAAATIERSETLTEFAINHFFSVQGATLSVSMPRDQPAPPEFTDRYVQALVRKLDIGQQYRTVLATRLDERDDQFSERRSRFMSQIPSTVLLPALEMKLRKQLSARAYAYIENLVEMPDSLARQLVDGQKVSLRPMLLQPAIDITPDPVSGVYLIGPEDEHEGPIILHALFNQAFSFKEYADKEALMLDMQVAGDLQALILDRVDPLIRRRYDHGGLIEAHIPWSSEGYLDGPTSAPGPVKLVGASVAGNILHFLFTETLTVLKALSQQQTVTTAQADWRSYVYLMSLGAEQVISFLPGDFGLLIAAWQSENLFKASAASAYEQRWGKAISEFSAALGLLLTSRRAARVDSQVEITPREEERVALTPDFSWGNNWLTPQLRSRLQSFQVSDIALSGLLHDPLYNLYQDPHTGKRYAAVAGQVYEVQHTVEQWRVVGPQGAGPAVRLNAEQQWEFVLNLGLIGGGGQVSRASAFEPRASIDHILVVEAQGMSEIRAAYPERADMIVEAHVQARMYLENCLYNLVPRRFGASVHGHISYEIAEFFGVSRPNLYLTGAIRKKATQLYLALTDTSLSPMTSRRYVVGTNRAGNQSTAAFISRNDPARRIYLTERFFEVPEFMLKRNVGPDGGFNPSGHYRAATLLHELSHLVSGTHDIAYLESPAPFVELLDDSTPGRLAVRRQLQDIRNKALSIHTPEDKLFRAQEISQGGDDIDIDGAVKAAVLRIAGKSTLEQARSVFFSDPLKRSQIILANADSLTVLVMTLGRRRLAPEFEFNDSVTSSR